jgi:cobalt/nickel transport system permease protein
MHIPSSMIDGAVCPVTAAVSVAGIALAATMAWKAEKKPTSLRFAAASVLLFAGQVVNFPVQAGTSGHLLGGVLAAALLGVPFGVLAITLVLTLQCLVFGDGGLSTLGANVLNMAVLGAGLGGWIWQRLADAAPSRRPLALGLAAWLSVLLAAFACSVELAAAGSIPFSRVAPAMLGIHALIGLGEGAITVAVMSILTISALRASERARDFLLGSSAIMLALVIAPFACRWPDGLEAVAGSMRFLHESVPAFVAPLPDYSIPAMSNAMLSTALAGGIGAILTFCAAWGIAASWRRCPVVK